jgi:hypothetical protein
MRRSWQCRANAIDPRCSGMPAVENATHPAGTITLAIALSAEGRGSITLDKKEYLSVSSDWPCGSTAA